MNTYSLCEDGLTLRARLKQATRDAILDAAAAAFATEGAAHVRIDDIAGRAGVAVGTVYNYFTDRAALVRALLDTRTQGLIAALDDAPAARTGPPAGRFEDELQHFVAVLARYVDANHVLLHVLIEEEQQRGIDSKSARRRRSVLGQLLDRAEQLMAKGMKVRALQKGDPVLYASLLLGMVRGLSAAALARGNLRAADSAEAIVAVFLRGAAR